SDLSPPILSTARRAFAPLRTVPYLLYPLRPASARSGPGAANWRILFRRLLFGLGNRIEHRHRFANETETARAGATRRRLRLRYGRRRHMDRFPPPSSPRSVGPTTFATHLR